MRDVAEFCSREGHWLARHLLRTLNRLRVINRGAHATEVHSCEVLVE